LEVQKKQELKWKKVEQTERETEKEREREREREREKERKKERESFQWQKYSVGGRRTGRVVDHSIHRGAGWR
jgi:hypothetical protein